MYGATQQHKKLNEACKRLKILYDKIPTTVGCMEHINKPQGAGGCNAWCCREQTPQVLYIEFLLSWEYIKQNYSIEKFKSLIKSCLDKYLFSADNKACVHFDAEKNMCMQHETRPYNCRIYGITPDEEFKPRFERLRVLYPNIKYQCGLVKTENRVDVTKKQIDNWWLELKAIEMSIGVKPNKITDEFYGSYRTYHDHILLEVLGEAGLEYLSHLRVYGSDEQKNNIIQKTLQNMDQFLNNSHG